MRSYQPLYAETLDELNKLRGEYEQYKEAQKKPDYLKTIAEELSDIKDILKENGLSKKTVAPDFTVQFAQGSADINETEQVRIEEFVKTLGTDYTISLELLGEASAEGERNANQRLSEVRMAKVKQALIKYGVAPSRISSERYRADNNGGPAHRRVMITVK